jgi:uncharacterized protein with ATP-grasp and redox domains
MIDCQPPPLMTSEPGSFARYTIVERKPQIILQVIEDNRYSPEIVAALDAFRQETGQGCVRLLTEQATDAAFWNQEAAAYNGRTWLELPWYFAETFFYRRLLEAVRYFQPGPWQGRDPFAVQKRAQERAVVGWMAGNWAQLEGRPAEELFEALLHSCLWGNRADLSNFTVREEVRSGAEAAAERHNILINHTDRVAALLAAGVARVDFVNDNSGRELLFDLILADFLLTEGWTQTAVFHLKGQPFFVSDAMIVDVRETLTLLQNDVLGQRLLAHLTGARLVLKADPFWTSCLMFRQMPPVLSAELARSDLVIFKGDVNYRRLLDDAHWPRTARMDEIAAYFPAPFVTLRTLKGEIMVGLEPGQAEAIAAQDPTWLINGKRGIIQYVNRGQVDKG